MEDAELIRRLRDEVRCLSEESGRWESQYGAMKIYADTLVGMNRAYWDQIVKLRKKVASLGGHISKDE